MGTAIARVKARRDFLAANNGVRVVTPAFILLVKPTALGVPRVGFTVSKRNGNAVARNRIKRRLREAARLALTSASEAGAPEAGAPEAGAMPSADHIFIARPRPTEPPFAALVADAQRAVAKARRKAAT